MIDLHAERLRRGQRHWAIRAALTPVWIAGALLLCVGLLLLTIGGDD